MIIYSAPGRTGIAQGGLATEFSHGLLGFCIRAGLPRVPVPLRSQEAE
jgi:hypothetical protein